MTQLYPGDIVKIRQHPAGTGFVRLLRVSVIDDDGDALGACVDPDGRRVSGLIVRYQWGDTLVACGRDEDCRAHLDLAMACALARTSASASDSRSKETP